MAKKKAANKMHKEMRKMSKGKVNPVVAGAAGAAVGAGVGVAASAVMNDDKSRKKMGEVVETVKDQANQYLENMKKSGTMEKGKQMAKETISSAAQSMQSSNNGQEKRHKSSNQKSKTGEPHASHAHH